MQKPFNKLKYTALTSDIAREYGFSDAHVRYLASNGKIPSIQVGRCYRFDPLAVEKALLKVNGEEATPVNDNEEDRGPAPDIDSLLAGL